MSSGRVLTTAAAIVPAPNDHWSLADGVGATATGTGSPGNHPGTVNGSGAFRKPGSAPKAMLVQASIPPLVCAWHV